MSCRCRISGLVISFGMPPKRISWEKSTTIARWSEVVKKHGDAMWAPVMLGKIDAEVSIKSSLVVPLSRVDRFWSSGRISFMTSTRLQF